MNGRGPDPLAGGLKKGSPLQERIERGIRALGPDRDALDPNVRRDFGDSLALDDALAKEHSNDRRWDYLLGHRPSQRILALEVHAATDGEVQAILEKKRAAEQQLGPHLRRDVRVARWFWASSGCVGLSPRGPRLRLAEEGIEFVGRRLQRKHLQPKDDP